MDEGTGGDRADGDAAEASPFEFGTAGETADGPDEAAEGDTDADPTTGETRGGADGPPDSEPAPLADVAAEVDRRRAAADEDDLFEEAFADVSVEVDDEDVWERLDADAEIREASADATPEGVVERVVDKALFCQRCEHFDEPPEMGCTHEGTEIVELVDVEHVRVRDCPVVAEREHLEGLE